MEKLMIITDTNSNIMPKDAAELGIETVTMPFNIDGNEYMDGVDLTNEEFFQKMQCFFCLRKIECNHWFISHL